MNSLWHKMEAPIRSGRRGTVLMSYRNVIEKYNEIYRKTDIENILDLWSVNRGDLNVYVHSPFCASICKFCYYKGVPFSHETDSERYEKFYSSYLPAAVRPFLPLLQERAVGNFFFGGGTPSLMRPETMLSVFGLFPGFKEVKSKTFEIHPAVWQREQIDVLASHGFNCCIIGIQSFDKGILERQGRPHATFEEVQELIKCIQSKGMYAAVDLIYMMDRQEPDEIFRRDLDWVSRLEPDVMSLQLNYDLISNTEDTERFFELIFGSALPKAYYWEGSDREEPSVNLKRTKKCFRYVRNDVPIDIYRREIFPFLDTLDEATSAVGRSERLPSVIGFGSYRNPRKNTFSIIRNSDTITEYIEINNDWMPEYFITYELDSRDFFRCAVEELERLKDIGPPPKGLKINLENRVTTLNKDTIYRKLDSQVDLSVTWDHLTPKIEEYIEKLKGIYPHWKWNYNK